MLWDSAYENGDEVIGDAIDVAHACAWEKEPATLVAALLDAGGSDQPGFIEEKEDRPGRYFVHDLWHHAPDYVQKRRRREEQRRARQAPAIRGASDSEFLRALAASGDAVARGALASAERRRAAPDGGHRTPSLAGQTGDALSPAPAPAPAPAPEEVETSSCSEPPEAASEPPVAGAASTDTDAQPPDEAGGRRASDRGATRGVVAPPPPEPQGGAPARSRGAARRRTADTETESRGAFAESDEPPVETLPCVGAGAKTYAVTPKMLGALALDFPGLDVREEVRRMRLWLEANPAKRKTARGCPRFIVGWLDREQNRRGGRSPLPRESPTERERDAIASALDRAQAVPLWREVLSRVAERAGVQHREAVARWLAPLRANVPETLPSTLVLHAPSRPHAAFVLDNYAEGIAKVASEVASEAISVEVRS